MSGKTVVIGLGVVLCVPLVLVLWSLGVPMEFAVSWVLLAIAFVLAIGWRKTGPVLTWPPAKPTKEQRLSEVARMAWTIDHKSGDVSRAMVMRVERIVRSEAARRNNVSYGSVTKDEIDEVLGGNVYDPLDDAVNGRRDFRRADLDRILTAIESLRSEERERT